MLDACAVEGHSAKAMISMASVSIALCAEGNTRKPRENGGCLTGFTGKREVCDGQYFLLALLATPPAFLTRAR
jgi:hypothetical protein